VSWHGVQILRERRTKILHPDMPVSLPFISVGPFITVGSEPTSSLLKIHRPLYSLLHKQAEEYSKV